MAALKSKKKAAPAKKTSSRRKVAAAPRAIKASVHPLHKHYFLEEQEDFLNKHPLVRIMITIFIMSVVFFLIVVWMNRDVLMMM